MKFLKLTAWTLPWMTSSTLERGFLGIFESECGRILTWFGGFWEDMGLRFGEKGDKMGVKGCRRQVVRQGPAKPLSPVRVRAAPPKGKLIFLFKCLK